VRRWGGLVALLSAFVAAANAQSNVADGDTTRTAAGQDSVRFAAVTYISGASVYVGAGRLDGLVEGAILEVFRGAVQPASKIAVVRAVFLSSRSAACEVVSATDSVQRGDSVRFHAAALPVTMLPTGAATPTSAARRLRSVRGHIGARYMAIERAGGARSSVAQQSLDLRLAGTRLGGQPVSFLIDARARTTRSARADSAGTVGRTNVYAASLTYGSDSGVRIAVGRQYSPSLAPVSLFDGVAVEVNRGGWRMGALVGTQPAPSHMGFSDAVREAGAYVELHQGSTAQTAWSVTAGGIGSRDRGELNRDFLFFQASVSTSALTAHVAQEVDVNRGWKRAMGEEPLSLTATFASMEVRLFRSLSVNGGIDSRKSVRLYRDYADPETEFDDNMRRGAWGGAGVNISRMVRIEGSLRHSGGGPSGTADYYTGAMSLDVPSRLHPGLRMRSTRLAATSGDGWLHSASVSIEPLSILRVEGSVGDRSENRSGVPSTATWFAVDFDVSLGRHWYALVSGARETAAGDRVANVYMSLVYRF
jgi:hypothetical protein